MDNNILLGGAAGQGMNTIGGILEKIIARSGYYIYFTKDYMSRVRGGHNFNQLRFSDKQLNSHKGEIDIIIALTEETVTMHKKRLNSDGIILCPEEFSVVGEKIVKLPFKTIAKDIGNEKVFGTIVIGVIIKMFDFPIDEGEKALKEIFDGEVLDMNLTALKKGWDLVETRYTLDKINKNKDRITINGNQAVGLGALAAGCTFFSAYPMTPGTGIMNYVASKQEELGIVVEQAEDEIAALNMVLGASFAGSRAMTSTSGGGYSLMVETLGLSGMTETPAVIANVQRPGPATGLPTRTAQGDLKFVIHAAQDEFPRMIIALRTVEDAFYQTTRAFNMADKYQIPVTILSDQYLADAGVTIEPYDFSKITIERHLATAENIAEEKYKRYKVTDNGVSPRIIPGKIEDQVFMVDSDEHDEFGHIIESDSLRNQMMEKRMKKTELINEDVQEPWILGSKTPEVLIIAWGSTYGPLKEAIEFLNVDEIQIAALVFGDVWPLPVNTLKDYSKKVKKIIALEGNYSGQLADIIQEQTCIQIEKRLCKYDGRQWEYEEIIQKVKEVL